MLSLHQNGHRELFKKWTLFSRRAHPTSPDFDRKQNLPNVDCASYPIPRTVRSRVTLSHRGVLSPPRRGKSSHKPKATASSAGKFF